MRTITHCEIVAAKDLPEAKRAICQYVAENLTEANPTLRFAFNDAGVYCRNDNGTISLIYGWDLFGGFRRLNPFLNVTLYARDLIDVRTAIRVEATVGGAS